MVFVAVLQDLGGQYCSGWVGGTAVVGLLYCSVWVGGTAVVGWAIMQWLGVQY